MFHVYLTVSHPIEQVYHLSKASARFYHEKANNTYGVIAAFFAELTATAVGLLFFIPGTAVAYFMMGLPVPAYPYIVFVFWMVSVPMTATTNALAGAVTVYQYLTPLSPYAVSEFISPTHIYHNRPR